jgi:hypothetical protein
VVWAAELVLEDAWLEPMLVTAELADVGGVVWPPPVEELHPAATTATTAIATVRTPADLTSELFRIVLIAMETVCLRIPPRCSDRIGRCLVRRAPSRSSERARHGAGMML